MTIEQAIARAALALASAVAASASAFALTIDLPKETTHGVAITPTLFPPMTRPEPDRTFTRDGRRT